MLKMMCIVKFDRLQSTDRNLSSIHPDPSLIDEVVCYGCLPTKVIYSSWLV